ncbi:MAG: hypothetical protein MZV65_28295 [Chromatiales bacterium]|nr:hypothetical protein [Chromatiales bacterium]
MRNAACLVHTAREEAFGLVIIEAGVSWPAGGGDPGRRYSGNHHRVRQPGSARSTLGDPDILASSIAIVLTAPDEAVAMRQKLYDRVAEQFSIEVMIGPLS